MVRKKVGSPSRARARGLRTLQHQTLSARVRHAIDTEVWLRGMVRARDPQLPANARWATKDQVHDEALAWFLGRHAQQPPADYPARRAGDEDLTFWVDSKIMERARRMALRDGVKVARLIDAALSAYVRQYIPEPLIEFRQRVQAEAQKLYGAVRAEPLAVLKPRK